MPVQAVPVDANALRQSLINNYQEILLGSEIVRALQVPMPDRIEQQSRHCYKVVTASWQDKVRQFQVRHAAALEAPGPVAPMVRRHMGLISGPVVLGTNMAIVALEFSGTVLGIISGLMQRLTGGSGAKLLMEIQEICSRLIQAVTVEIPELITTRINGTAQLTAGDFLDLSIAVTTFHHENIRNHADKVASLEGEAARWRAEGPQTLYNAISKRTQDFALACQNECKNLQRP